MQPTEPPAAVPPNLAEELARNWIENARQAAELDWLGEDGPRQNRTWQILRARYRHRESRQAMTAG